MPAGCYKTVTTSAIGPDIVITMKTIHNYLFLIGCVSTLAWSPSWAIEESPSQAAPPELVTPANPSLQTGVFEEEANLDSNAALAAYQGILERFDAQRAEAAQAIFRAAEIFRKTGNLTDAHTYYARILREFSDQSQLARQSQRQLATIHPSASAEPDRFLEEQNSPWLLNVAFGSSLNKRGKAAFGVGTNDYWNGYYLPWINVVPLVNLMLWNGNITPVGMEIRNAAGVWNNKTGDPMYDAYVYVNDGSDKNIIITLTNLPPGQYDFYLYGHADPGGQGEGNSQFQISTGDHQTDWIGTAQSAGWSATQPWTEGKQFIRFCNIKVNQDDPVIVRVRAGFDGEPIEPKNRPPVINGMQIIRTGGAGGLDEASVAMPAQAGPSLSTSEGATMKSFEAQEQHQRTQQLLDTLRESHTMLRTQVLTDLHRQMAQAQERVFQARAQLEEARRIFRQVEEFKDKPELLPKPAASDPRYRKLKEALDQATLASLDGQEDSSRIVKASLKSMFRFIEEIYLTELKAASGEAANNLDRSIQALNDLKQRLAKEQELLAEELAAKHTKETLF